MVALISNNWVSKIVAANRKLFDYALKFATPVALSLIIMTDVSNYD